MFNIKSFLKLYCPPPFASIEAPKGAEWRGLHSHFVLHRPERFQKKSILLFSAIFFMPLLSAETFTVAPKKKQSKITVEQVCQHMMPENIISARINSLLGQNQAAGLSWIDDVMEEAKDALFTVATQEQLQKFMEMEQSYSAALEQFELVLRERREFLKNWKQEVLTPKNKK